MLCMYICRCGEIIDHVKWLRALVLTGKLVRREMSWAGTWPWTGKVSKNCWDIPVSVNNNKQKQAWKVVQSKNILKCFLYNCHLHCHLVMQILGLIRYVNCPLIINKSHTIELFSVLWNYYSSSIYDNKIMFSIRSPQNYIY